MTCFVLLQAPKTRLGRQSGYEKQLHCSTIDYRIAESEPIKEYYWFSFRATHSLRFCNNVIASNYFYSPHRKSSRCLNSVLLWSELPPFWAGSRNLLDVCIISCSLSVNHHLEWCCVRRSFNLGMRILLLLFSENMLEIAKCSCAWSGSDRENPQRHSQ